MLKVYNTLTQKKETFRPRKGKKVNLFVCGPTVYDFSHLGHARTYVAFDMIVKYLRQKGYDVFYLQNITDLDDKIIKRAAEKNIPPQKLAKVFEREYLKDVKALKINSVSKYARATNYIKEIISQTERLLKKGFAYQIEDGIYYDISKFKNYGKLSKRAAFSAERAVSRIDESISKKNKGDFCLWKFSKTDEPLWDFKTGEYLGIAGPAFAKALAGRPGWHIEDTAITEKFFGTQYDIHGGARDLIFPHHEAEIAQMEAISGKKPLVKYWLHTGFLTVNGEKMSKSLGNFITIRDFLKNHSLRLLRFLIIKSHYRSPIDYSEKIIEQAKAELERIDEFVNKIQNSKTEPRAKRGAKVKMKANPKGQTLSLFQKRFTAAMQDDFNTPQAIAVIFDLINKENSLIADSKLSASDAKNILSFLKEADEFFGFIFWPKNKEKISENILMLIKEREEARKSQSWRKADELRNKITKLGWQIEDTESGPKLKKL